MRTYIALVFTILTLETLPISSQAAEDGLEWGGLKGQLVVSDPQYKTPEFMKASDLFRHVVVYVEGKVEKIHPRLQIGKLGPSVLKVHDGGRKVVLAQIDRPLNVTNGSREDLIFLCSAWMNTGQPFVGVESGIIKPNKTVELLFRDPEPSPFAYWARGGVDQQGFIVLLHHPYGVEVTEDGSFELLDLPAGEHVLKVWGFGISLNGVKGFPRREKKILVKPGLVTDLGQFPVRPPRISFPD